MYDAMGNLRAVAGDVLVTDIAGEVSLSDGGGGGGGSVGGGGDSSIVVSLAAGDVTVRFCSAANVSAGDCPIAHVDAHVAEVRPERSGTLRLRVRGAAAVGGAAPSYPVVPSVFDVGRSRLVGDGAAAATARNVSIHSSHAS